MQPTDTQFSRRTFLQIAGAVGTIAATGLGSPTAASAAPALAAGPRARSGTFLPRGVAARYLIEEDFYFVEKSRYVQPDAWDIDQAGAIVAQQYGRWFRVADTSSLLPVLLMRPFQPQDTGTVILDFRIDPVTATLDGFSFSLRDGTTPVAQLRVVGNQLGLRTSGSDVALATLAADVEVGIRLKVNLSAGTATVFINGTRMAHQVPLLASGATIDNLLVASEDASRGDLYFGPVRLYRDTVLNEQFIHVVPGAVPTAWTSAASGVTLSVVEKIHSSWADRFSLQAETGLGAGTVSAPAILSKQLSAGAPISVAEFAVRFEAGTGMTYRAALADGTSLAVEFGTTHIRVRSHTGALLHERMYVPSLWNRVRVRIHVPTSTATIQVNGKKVLEGVTVLNGAATLLDPPVSAALEITPSSRILLDDLRVYTESPLPSDYAPVPVAASTGSTHHLGMSEFGGWRTGHHLGWDLITRFPERKPYLGWYDDGIPEVADWENLWMAEAGIAFRLQCWFRPSVGVGNPIKTPDLADSLHDGYFDSEYGDTLKFAIMWENASGGQTNQTDFRQNIVPYLIENYFRDPRYYTIDNKPVMSLWSSSYLLANFGSVAGAKEELDYLRTQVQALGFDDIIYMAVNPGADGAALGITAEYAYSYDGYAELQTAVMTQRNAVSPVQVLATVSMGRDDLPWIRTMGRNIPPAEFKEVTDWVRDTYIPSLPAGHLGRRLTMFGNWNEWGEGHFLQPSEFHGFEYLDAIRATFSTGTASNVRPTAAQQTRLQRLYPFGRELPPALPAAPARSGTFDVDWDFATAGDTEGWTNLTPVSGFTAAGGALTATSSQHDPQVASPAGLGLEAADHPYLRIRMRSTPIQQGEIFFITESDGTYSTSKGARFMAIPEPGQTYGEIDVPMWRVPTWRGRIHQIRIDPIVDIGTFEIDYVGLELVPMTGPRVRLNGTLEPRRRPEIHGGIVYASPELVINTVGGRVGTSPDGDAIHIARGSHTVTIPTTGTSIQHNGSAATIDAAAVLLADGSFGVPISFFSDILGFDVTWDAGTEELSIIGTPIVLTVKADGTGDFTSPKLANESILDASPQNPYVIEVHPGEYLEREWTVKPYVTVRGTDRDTVILRGDLPDSATDAQITGSSTLWLVGTSTLENLTVHAKNMRYAIHDEGNGANLNAVHTVRNCRIVHAGNEDAKAWRTANPGSGLLPANVWAYDRPYGYGSASGVHLLMEDSILVGRQQPFYVHNNQNFAAPNINELIRCDLQLSTGAFGVALATQSLGSGTADTVTLTDCTWSPGYIDDTDTPWIPQTPARQVSDHSEFSHTVSGTAALGYLARQRGVALRLYAADLAATSISVSGSAAPALFGTPVQRAGGGGFRATVYGSLDISGIAVGLQSNVTVANTLGRRLGDRTASPLQLVVTANGVTGTVTFDQNHTAQSNATIIALINAAIPAVAQAQEYQIPQNEYYPSFPDREITRTVNGANGVLRWGAVVAVGTTEMKAASTANTVADVIGVSLDRAVPGSQARVLTSGYLHRSQLAGTIASFPAGTPIYLSDTNSGQFSLTGTRQFATAVATDWVEFSA
ncbi:glycoside hydrolase family 99-like domain-containing protein [Schumannella luteola]